MHFEVVFVQEVRLRSRFPICLFGLWMTNGSSVSSIELLCNFAEYQLGIFIYLWVLYSAPFVYVSIPPTLSFIKLN